MGALLQTPLKEFTALPRDQLNFGKTSRKRQWKGGEKRKGKGKERKGKEGMEKDGRESCSKGSKELGCWTFCYRCNDTIALTLHTRIHNAAGFHYRCPLSDPICTSDNVNEARMWWGRRQAVWDETETGKKISVRKSAPALGGRRFLGGQMCEIL